LVFTLGLAIAASGCSGGEESDPTASAFDRSVLHRIEITVASEHLSELETSLDARVPCTITYDGETVEEAGIRQKGNLNSVTSLTSKPSFSVKFDEFDKYGQVFGLNKILLNSAGQDPTFLRDQLGSDMYARAGLPAARTAHGLVTLNGLTYGLYVIVEAVDTTFLARTFGEYNSDGNLYEGPCCGDFTDVSHLELKDEKDDDRSREDMEALAGVVLNTPDAELEVAVRERLDLDGFILGYALDASLGHWDGFSFRLNNYYMYNNPADGRFVLMPHGMDRVLEEVDFDPLAFPEARLSQRVRQIPALNAAFQASMARVANEIWDAPALVAEIDKVVAAVGAAKVTDDRSEGDIAAFNEHAITWRETIAARKDVLVSAAQGAGQ
jgi:spore coat protein CotH